MKANTRNLLLIGLGAIILMLIACEYRAKQNTRYWEYQKAEKAGTGDRYDQRVLERVIRENR